jgi:hypothetical protein
VSTLAGSVAVGLRRASASSSFLFTRSQFFGSPRSFVRTSVHPPRSFRPSSQISTFPPRSALAIGTRRPASSAVTFA